MRETHEVSSRLASVIETWVRVDYNIFTDYNIYYGMIIIAIPYHNLLSMFKIKCQMKLFLISKLSNS